MKRKIMFILPLFILAMAVSIWAQNGPVQAGQGQNVRVQANNGICLVPASATVQTLSEAEAGWLVLMREEEKLARDVYTALYEQWGVLVFENIAKSKQRHFDAIGTLVARYGLQDPAADDTDGIFTNPDVASLYSALIARGALSVTEALSVGATIEELGIRDLTLASAATDNSDILNVYSNLTLGSMTHLRTFVSHLQVLGATYTPQYLDAGTFNAILSATGPGRGRR